MSDPPEYPALPRAEHAPADRAERFVRLTSKHEKRVFAYIMSLVMDWSVAQDLYQETNMRLWRQFDEYRQGTDFGAWACTIAYYQVLTYREKQGREKLRFSPAFLATLAESVAQNEEQEASTQDRLRLLADCRRKLNPTADELLKLVYGEGLQVREAAKRLGRSAAAVYKSLTRIRQALHRCIEKRMRAEGSK